MRKPRALLLFAALSVVIAACSGQPAAPPTVETRIAPPATVAPLATSLPTTAPAIAESPLQPSIDVSPLRPGTGVSPLLPSTASSYEPVSNEACEALRKSISDAFKADAQAETAAFRDYAIGVLGQACEITLRGTGATFPGVVPVAQQLETLFGGQGWSVDPAYAADSPTGILFGLRKGNQLALVDAGWIASAGVNCPKDQPISACDIKPEQKNYIVRIDVAQGK